MKQKLPAFLAASVAFAACSSAPPYVALAIENDAEQISNVVVADRALQDVVRVGRPFVERIPGTNQLKIAVPVRNLADAQVQLLVQVSFLDAQRTPVGDDTNRQVMLLSSGATQTHVAVSKLDTVRDWVMRISWNR